MSRREGTLRRAALADMLRAARLMITATQSAIGGCRLSVAPAPFYLRRASERLTEARKTGELL
jgi:hypothetical protein